MPDKTEEKKNGGTEIAPVDSTGLPTIKPVKVTDQVVRNFLFGSNTKLTKEQQTLFIETAKVWQLNPFKREIHVVPFKNKSGGYDIAIVIGYETFIRRGERSKRLDGWKAWVEGDSYENLVGKIMIWRKDWSHPFEYEVAFSEVARDNNFWKKSSKEQLKKTVIAKGFRLCFSEELGGMPYTDIEIEGSMGGAWTEAKNITPPTLDPEAEAEKQQLEKIDGLVVIARGLWKQCRDLAKELKKKEQYTVEDWEKIRKEIGWTGPKPTLEQANRFVGDLQKDLQELRMEKTNPKAQKAVPSTDSKDEKKETKKSTDELPLGPAKDEGGK